MGRLPFPGRRASGVGRRADSRLPIRDSRFPTLKAALDTLYTSYNAADSATDPIQIVRRFRNPADREVVGFCAAALAFGRVASVLQSIERLLAVMGPSPAGFAASFDPRRDGAKLTPLVHRWTRGEDLIALLIVLRTMLSRGSIEAFFLEGYDPAADDTQDALESFSVRAQSTDLHEAYGRRRNAPRDRLGICYFFPKPSSGSGCKRLNLFLRWMVRRDAVDLGIWSRVSPAKLIVPLDTHVIRVGRCLRLTKYASPGWKMAREITQSLRALDPEDPVKYDFSLCHIGMADLCGFIRAKGDSACPLKGLCRPS
jgi:uncharacterized protein (TIGR02757 family)